MATTKKPQGPPSYFRFVQACLGGVTGWLFVHPMDVLKVRLQLQGGEGGQKIGTFKTALNVIEKEGFLALYSGLSAAIMRQVVYTTARISLYEIFRDAICHDPKNVTFVERASSGVSSGAVAAMISCPVEVSLVRMQADGRLPVSQRLGYKHIFDALFRIAKEEGPITYWRGSTPTVVRAMVVGLTQVGCYDQFKSMYLQTGYFVEGIQLHLTSSITAGLVYSFASMPFDTTKTRMQSQRPGPDGQLPYKSTVGTMLKVAKNEGITSLWKGFGAYFARSGGHTIAMFLALEQYKTLFQKIYS